MAKMTVMPVKAPEENLDYVADFSAEFAGALSDGSNDRIASVIWVVPDELTQTNTSNTDSTATIWLHGGTERITYEVTCRVSTTGGRTYERTFKLPVGKR